MPQYDPKTHPASALSHPAFEWRAALGPWRWLILGTLGVAPGACGGRAGSDAQQGSPNAQGQGGGLVPFPSSPVTRTPDAYPPPPTTGGTGAGGASSGFGGSATSPLPPVSVASDCVPESALGGNWVRCTNGMLHRPQQGVCNSTLPRDRDIGLYYDPIGPDAGYTYACRHDSDCSAAPHGYCAEGQIGPYCAQGCVRDADCAANHVCLCGPDIGQCWPAECSTDAECGGSSLCGSYEVQPNCGGIAFGCQTAADDCAGNLDCGSGYCIRDVAYSSDPAEAANSSAIRRCSDSVCDVGRPFLINGTERLAPSVVRGDWYADTEHAHVAPTAGAVDSTALQQAIAQGWLEQALMEHASVAAFARFSLQLLHLGAPAELVAAAATAMQDEIRHARACFALARRHRDEDVGPGPLGIDGALTELDLCSIVLCTVREGCVGETVAALEAAEALEHCEDAVARAVLAQISVEEGRHAELAWRFVAWALAAHPELTPHVREAFATELTRKRTEGEPGRDGSARLERELLRHGLLSGSLRVALRGRVLRAVVAPCAEALLERSASSAAPQSPNPSDLTHASNGSSAAPMMAKRMASS